MRRLTALILSSAAAVAFALGAAAPALADSPHFLRAANALDGASLVTSFKEAGLGTGTTSVTITLNVAEATADYQCFNNGGNHPQAANKKTVVTSLAVSGDFPVRNGQTTGSLTVGPPAQGDFACPPGQSLFLQDVTYAGITVSDAFGTTADATPDPVSTGPVHILTAG
jgi:hypothetical protein